MKFIRFEERDTSHRLSQVRWRQREDHELARHGWQKMPLDHRQDESESTEVPEEGAGFEILFERFPYWK